MLKEKEAKWLDFFAGLNTIKITNEEEFTRFYKFLSDVGLDYILKNYNDFSDWQHLSRINNHNPDCIIFEYQPGKGLTFGSTLEKSKEWYGEEPLTVECFNTFYNNSRLVEQVKVFNEHKPIIDKDTFEKARTILSERDNMDEIDLEKE